MQSYSADLLALYANAPALKIYRAHLFQIGPCRNGAFLYATDGRAPITFGGNQYHPWAFGFWKRGQQKVKVGWESNSIDCPLYSDEQFQPIYFPGTNNGVYLLDGVYAGLLASAPVTIYRATMTTWGLVTGSHGGSLVSTRFVGEIGEIKDLGPTKCTVTVRDPMYRLNMDFPNQLVQTGCRWVLYSQGCTANKATFTKTGGIIGSVSDPRTFMTVLHMTPVSAAGTWTKGVVTFTGGKNNGISYAVGLWTSGGLGPDTFQLDRPPLFNMAPGDTFSVSQGCDHGFAACTDFLGSTAAYENFGGDPFVPVPETAV